ncbi:MAG: hypothetical protein IT430_08065 [Phycisphaerales bacterium]|nr:hypothetical protein [Phycisphaerales bacterium]
MMRDMVAACVLGCLALQPTLGLTVHSGTDVTSPAEHLGRPVGGDFTLTDWAETSSYLLRLGEESPNVITTKVGTTTEGRDFLISIISSEANLNDLDAIKANARILADPRGRSAEEIERAAGDGRVTLFVSCAMHATECAGVQFGMEFAYTLATSDDEPWKSARDKMVVVLYMTNPDGIDHVTNWYRQTVGTPHEGADLLKLYQYYSGHDNNRDWFMLTQNETRIVSELLYTEWFPQIYWDVHQQGSSGERLFVPPYRDPLNPNLDPNIITGIDALGSRALLDLTREGFTGVSTGVSYDMWWNGGNRNVPVRHNIIGILTEAASANLASPIFLPINRLSGPVQREYAPSNQFPMPWPGGWWRLRDIIDYEMAFGRSLVGSLSREPSLWLRNAADAAQRAIAAAEEGAPRAWIIPSDNRDPDAVARFVDVLLATGVEINVSEAEIEADGRTYPTGSIVIQREQPYGTHVKDLMEVQRYPEGDPPYDVAGWTLPYLLGVRRVEVMQAIEAPLKRVSQVGEATARFVGDDRCAFGEPGPLSAWHSGTWTEVSQTLVDGRTWEFNTSGDQRGLFELEEVAQEDGDSIVVDRLPRIGLYSPWSGSMDEGWMRWVLDTWKIPYVPVRNEMIRAGQLGDFLDVLIIADVGARQLDEGRGPGSIADEYTRGLSPEGAVAVEEFVRGGGRLITFDSSSQWAIDLMKLPVANVTRAPEAREFSCPGSVLRGIAEEHDLTVGLPESVALFFSGSSAFRPMNDKERKDAGIESAGRVETLLRYAPTRVLLSGWIKSPEIIEGQGAWLRAEHGKGAVHLFAFRPQYRGWSQGTFGLVFRAAILDQ